MALALTPENFRAEMARYGLTKRQVADAIGMHPNQLSQYVIGSRPLQAWAAHNIGWGINTLSGRRVLDVDMDEGVRPAPKPGRIAGWNRPAAVDPRRVPNSNRRAG